MKTLRRVLANICSDNLDESKAFYTSLFDFKVDYDTDWFVHLTSEDQQFELGIISNTSEVVPEHLRTDPAGFYLTLVVDNADEVFEIAQSENFQILNPPEDTFYGQRRLLLKDPNGAVVDVSSPIPGFRF